MPIPDRTRIKEALLDFINREGRGTRSVTPRQAYRGLAEHFRLTSDDLKLERNWDNLWQNEVRWARQELVTEGYLSPKDISGYGSWQLNSSHNPHLNESRQVADKTHPLKSEIEKIYDDLSDEGVFDPSSLSDARDTILRAIVQRRGQALFRQMLLKAYSGRCAITDDKVPAVLEAAHIVPYSGIETNNIQNGLLLRSDVHTLFDLHLLEIDQNYRVSISPSLKASKYVLLEGKLISIPSDQFLHPSKLALRLHQEECDF